SPRNRPARCHASRSRPFHAALAPLFIPQIRAPLRVAATPNGLLLLAALVSALLGLVLLRGLAALGLRLALALGLSFALLALGLALALPLALTLALTLGGRLGRGFLVLRSFQAGADESGFGGGPGQCGDTTVEAELPAVERRLRDPLGLGGLGE